MFVSAGDAVLYFLFSFSTSAKSGEAGGGKRKEEEENEKEEEENGGVRGRVEGFLDSRLDQARRRRSTY